MIHDSCSKFEGHLSACCCRQESKRGLTSVVIAATAPASLTRKTLTEGAMPSVSKSFQPPCSSSSMLCHLHHKMMLLALTRMALQAEGKLRCL